jgi:hypothetical protein
MKMAEKRFKWMPTGTSEREFQQKWFYSLKTALSGCRLRRRKESFSNNMTLSVTRVNLNLIFRHKINIRLR